MRDKALIRAGERVDDLQIKGYEIIQHPGRFCFGMDAVLLSSFVKVKKGEKVLDSSQSFWRQRMTGGIIPALKSSRRVRTWQGEASCTTGWKIR